MTIEPDHTRDELAQWLAKHFHERGPEKFKRMDDERARRLAEEPIRQRGRQYAEMIRIEERKAQTALALQLIDIGFKALATKLHPDKGGSREAMARLNNVRRALKTFAGARNERTGQA